MPVSLIDMPDVVMNRLFEELDFRAIMTLRKVNHALRDFIDENKPDGKITTLDVTVHTNKAIVTYTNAFAAFVQFEYVGTDNGCQIEYRGKKTQMAGLFYEQMLKDLKFIFQFQKTCLESFEIGENSECEDTIYNKFLDDLAHILEPINLKVIELDIESISPFPILKSLDAKTLKEVNIWGNLENDDIHQIDIDDIKNLEVWKNLELEIQGFTIDNEEIQDLLKVKMAFVLFRTITENQLKDVLEAFLTSSTIEEFRLEYINLDGNVECFGEPFTKKGQVYDQRYYFEISKSSEVVWITRGYKFFWFSRMDRGKVPTGAIIQIGTMPISLIDMPDVVMNRLFEELDFREIMTLRKVNHALRDFIDVNKPDGKITSLDVTVKTNTVIVEYTDAFTAFVQFEYVGTDDGCYVKYENKQTPMTGKFYEQTLKDLKFMLEFQKSCLESFEIGENSKCEGTIYNKILNDVAQILEPINLKVTRFIIGSNDPVPILKMLDAKTLKDLYIWGNLENDEVHQIDIGDMKNLEVWKNLEFVQIQGATIDNEEIQDLLKIKDVFVPFRTITENQLTDVLEAFLTSATIGEFCLDYIDLEGDAGCFGEPFIEEGEDDLNWYFEISKSSDVVSISRGHKFFWFSRMDRGKVPTGAIIQIGAMTVPLMDIPDVVMNRIFEELDFRAIMTLRKVNRALRDFIDVNKPDAKFTSLDVIVETNTVIVKYSDVFTDFGRFACVETNNGYQLEYHDKKIHVEGMIYKLMLEDLKFIFQFQKSCLERLDIQGKSMCDESIFNEFLDDLAHILEPINLKVTRLDIDFTNPLPFLKSLNAKFLKYLHVLHQVATRIDIGDIKNLEVWKNLEMVRIRFCTIHNGEIQDFLMFKKVFVIFPTITEKQLKEILEAFLTSSTIEEFRLNYRFLDGNASECFGEPFNLQNQVYQRAWYYKILESTKILSISWSSDANFKFIRIDKEVVPARATIQRYRII